MSVDTERGLLLVLLLNTAHLGTGDTVFFSTVGGSVTLPCRGVIRTDCSTTTWLFSSRPQRTAVELVTLGRIGDQKPGRVSLGSDCSLHVHTLSTQDTGLYTCQQFVNDQQQGQDSPVYLSLLTIQVSPGAELRTGSTVTLHCLLDTYRGPALCFSYLQASIKVIWVTETGAELQGDRYQISSSLCSSNLTVRLQPSDHSRQWRCDVTQERAVKFTHRYSTPLTDKATVATESTSTTTPTTTSKTTPTTTPTTIPATSPTTTSTSTSRTTPTTTPGKTPSTVGNDPSFLIPDRGQL
ncbi:exocyst complex component 5-like [Lepisosteus oculatus]|uniref:exocyst complex component 5-like n=1 Tax=Lepisosteus oculatus TaxID=7918 RepID=UPI0035F50489